MNVGQVILERSWLFDKDVIIYDRFNICQFELEGKKIKLVPSRSKVRQPEQRPNIPKKTKGINLISVKAFDQKLKKGASFMILTDRDVEGFYNTIPPEVTFMIK